MNVIDDDNGNLIEIRYPASNTAARQGVVDYEYDSADRVDLVTVQLGDEAVPVADSFQYKPFGPTSQLTFGNTLIDARSFDSRYQLGTWTLGTTALGTLLSYTHSFDKEGNLETRTDAITSANNRTFAYDEIHRLTSAAGPWGAGTGCSGSKAYAYDKNGNRTYKGESGTATTYAYTSGSLGGKPPGRAVPKPSRRRMGGRGSTRQVRGPNANERAACYGFSS